MSQPVTVPPAAALQPFIVGYADVFVPLPPDQRYAARIIPIGCPAIVLFHEGQIRITDGPAANQIAPPAGFVGQLTRSGGNEYTGTIRGFIVQLTPAGAYDLLRCEVSRYQNATVPLHQALGAPMADGIARQLRPDLDFAGCCAAADAFFLHQLAKQQATLGLGGQAAALLMRSQGQLEVEDVALQLEVSVRTLLRRFSREVGMPPKTFARLVRFRAAHAYLQEPDATWADAVLRFGYTDQSHLIRDYRDFAGETPRQYQTDGRVLDRIFRTQSSTRS
ncbi:helix-turn-helix transcriptional regulator [Solirubrum puertoriconensis]|uniref:HTH araC/xylS-type domain-containing protein n=1 Tax=Solirubrum puertoriconensis TaxID=1751427 RepID=A0A9X0HL83_SOLP1|nr:helix-turn-helix transcriptional regulator [Solirubrum puertoriconensis]KUG07976.1 hypothetical protein ASU33_07135 [Solirubrum puertoriconensis]